MFRRISTMPPEERFSRSFIGILLVASAFVSWGSWVALIIGILFIVSVLSGVCLLCELYKMFASKKS